MKLFFKYILPVVFIFSVILTFISRTGHAIMFGFMLFLLFPMMIIYATSVFAKVLQQRKKYGDVTLRNVLVILSLLTLLSIIIKLFAQAFFIPGFYTIGLFVFLCVTLNLLIAIIYFVKNWKGFNLLIPYEFLITILPSMFVIWTYYLSSHIPVNDLHEISSNRNELVENNQKILNKYVIDSLVIEQYKALEEIENSIINLSGGVSEEGRLVGAKDKDTPATYLIRMKALDELEDIIHNSGLGLKSISWSDSRSIEQMTVADIVLKIEVLKNRLLIMGIQGIQSDG